MYQRYNTRTRRLNKLSVWNHYIRVGACEAGVVFHFVFEWLRDYTDYGLEVLVAWLEPGAFLGVEACCEKREPRELHFYDFWIPELKTKFIDGDMSGVLEGETGFRYFKELQHKCVDPVRVGLYVLSFIFLALHLMHGFQSAFQSVGFRHNKYTPVIQKLGTLYAIVVPAGFIVIALFHFINY